MKHIITLTFFLLMWSFSHGQSSTLHINITGVNSDQGKILIALYDEAGKAQFVFEPEHAFKRAFGKISGSKATAVIYNVPYGKYAVSLFQDINGDNKLNRAPMGFPVEPYGFSNNPPGLGVPGFEKAAFTTDSKTTRLEINLKEFKNP